MNRYIEGLDTLKNINMKYPNFIPKNLSTLKEKLYLLFSVVQDTVISLSVDKDNGKTILGMIFIDQFFTLFKKFKIPNHINAIVKSYEEFLGIQQHIIENRTVIVKQNRIKCDPSCSIF
jgi:hypothetical protein